MAEPQRRWVYLFGNGLSLMFNEDFYRLSNLTRIARARLNSMPGLRSDQENGSLLSELEEINAALATDQQQATIRSFEDLAGPVDRLSNVLSVLGPLSRLGDENVQEVIWSLGSELRVLYKRVVGVVLRAVMSHGNGRGEWGYVRAIAQHLVSRCLHQRELDVFVLNYDALLDALLVRLTGELENSNRSFNLMDEFDGRNRSDVPVLTPQEDVRAIETLAWRTDAFTPNQPFIRLHHLHGAGMWMRFRGTVYKATSLQEMRNSRIYESWATGVEGQEEEGFVDPVVLLGDQKEASVGRRPFDETYQELIRALTEATDIAIAGYSFQDLPLNRMLREYRGEARVLVVNTSVSVATLKSVFGVPAWPRQLPDWLTLDGRGLPEGLVTEQVPAADLEQ